MRFSQKLCLVFFFLLIASGCSQQSTTGIFTRTITPVPTRAGSLPAYLTSTPSPTSNSPTLIPQIPATPMPTSTPVVHEIKQGETLLGIAIRYGIQLEELKAANPDVDPRSLSIGQEITIPVREVDETQVASVTPTVIPIRMGTPRCFDRQDGLACIVDITNDHETNIEGIRIDISLYDKQRRLLYSQVNIPSMNRLLPGQSLPVEVLFEGIHEAELTETYLVQANVLSALAVEPIDDSRYVDVTLDQVIVDVHESRLFAEATGTVRFTTPASQVWLVGIAYDQEGQAIGLRKVKLNTGCIQVQLTPDATTNTPTTSNEITCPPIPFQLLIYSLGPEISSVIVISEAVP